MLKLCELWKFIYAKSYPLRGCCRRSGCCQVKEIKTLYQNKPLYMTSILHALFFPVNKNFINSTDFEKFFWPFEIHSSSVSVRLNLTFVYQERLYPAVFPQYSVKVRLLFQSSVLVQSLIRLLPLLTHHCYAKNHPIWYFWNLERSWNVHNFSPLAKISPFCFFILSYIVLLWCHSCDVGYITKNSICKVFQNIIIKTLAILVVLWQNVLRFKQFLSSRGLGHCPLKAVTRVRISLGTPNFIKNQNNYLYNHFNSDIITNKAGGLCPEDEPPL